MDGNGVPMGGFLFMGLPLGFGMAMAVNEQAKDRYTNMTEAEKERIIMQCKDARTDDEIKKIVDSLVPDGNASSLYDGPAAK